MNSNSCDEQPQPLDLRSAVLEFEAKLIRQALTAADNKPTAAARLLGLTSHQACWPCWTIGTAHCATKSASPSGLVANH